MEKQAAKLMHRMCKLSLRSQRDADPVQIKFRRDEFKGVCTCPYSFGPFCRRCLPKMQKAFRSSLEKTFSRCHCRKQTIEKIELEMLKVDSQLISLLEKWIPILLVPDMSLKTFSLCFSWSREYFDLPSVVYQIKSLKKLCLEFCRVNQFFGTVLLRCLQTLSLKNVYIEVETIEKLMSSCPLIENVVLEECDGLRAPNNIRIKHNKLKRFTFSNYVEISFEDDDCPSIVIYAPNLISLSLKHVQLYNNYFENLSSNFPRLEDLSVLYCKGHGELILSSRSIKHLTLEVEQNLIEATIDAPNLQDFKFFGLFPQTSLTFATTSSEWKSRVHLEIIEDDLPWFKNLGELLRALTKSQISLDISYDNLQPNQQIEEEGGFNHEPVVVETLRFGLNQLYAYGSPSLPHFLNGLFSVCRPRYIQTLYNEKELFDFLCKVLVIEREKRDYFWKKDLEEVGMQVWDKETNEWKPTSLLDCQLISTREFRFRLKWSDSSLLLLFNSFSLHTLTN